jgi:hypothetical protein
VCACSSVSPFTSASLRAVSLNLNSEAELYLARKCLR